MPQTTTTWKFTNASIVLNEKASKPADTAMSIHADSIIRNDKPLTGTVVNLTVAHLADPTFRLTLDEKARTATVVRTEGKRGRKERTGADASSVNTFLARFTSK